mmetsp:Transcript_15204/g.41709  ORF Transcript_15204/g.41709 Transcript_15204/m.41709 type:complete len:87 (+) Transcript_15204:648-908(+)
MTVTTGQFLTTSCGPATLFRCVPFDAAQEVNRCRRFLRLLKDGWFIMHVFANLLCLVAAYVRLHIERDTAEEVQSTQPAFATSTPQ